MRASTTIKSLVLALAFSLAGCTYIFGPVKLAQAFTESKSQVIDEMAKAMEKSPTAAGLADARKAFEAKKADLIAKRDEIKAGPKGKAIGRRIGQALGRLQRVMYRSERRLEEIEKGV